MNRAVARLALLLALCLSLAFAGGSPAFAQGSQDLQEPRQILVLMRLAPNHLRLNSGYDGGYGDTRAQNAGRRVARRIARQFGLTLVDDWPMPLIGLDCFVMDVPETQSAQDAAARVGGDPRVAFAEPMHAYRTEGGPRGAGRPSGNGPRFYNDPLFAAQPDARAWRLADLHELSTGAGVSIALIDSAVEATHPDLAGQVSVSRNFVTGRDATPEAHGTGVAGIIAAKGNNGIGIVGVAPGARLMALRACWERPGHPAEAANCDTLSLAKALHFAVEHRAQVINLSLAGPADTLLGRLLDVALAQGASVVAAFDPALPGGGFPAAHHGVTAVSDEALAGSPPGVYTAPGKGVITTQPGGRWYLVNGSSYAAAHVTGLFALLRERSGKDHGGDAPVLIAARSGGGAIDTCASLIRESGPCDCSCSRGYRQARDMRR